MTADRIAVPVLAAGFGWLVAGGIGLVIGLVAAAVAQLEPPVLEVVAVALPAAMAIATLTEGDLDTTRIIVFATERPVSHQLGLATLIVWSVLAVRVWRGDSASAGPVDDPVLDAAGDAEAETRSSVRSLTVLALMVIVAVVAAAFAIV